MILTDADSLVPSFTAPQVHGNTTIAFTLTADDGMILTDADSLCPLVYRAAGAREHDDSIHADGR